MKDLDITDFFELLRYACTYKVKILDKYPFILDFALRAFYSEKEDVSDELKNVNTMQEDVLFQICFGHIDTYKFKEDIEPFKVYKMLRWMGTAIYMIFRCQVQNFAWMKC